VAELQETVEQTDEPMRTVLVITTLAKFSPVIVVGLYAVKGMLGVR
jgi:hypothetical protein